MTTSIAPSNRDQALAWDGDEGSYWAANHEIFESCLADYEPAFFAAAAIRAGDRVLDVGCGTGGTARTAARAASRGSVLGVDLSAEMIGVAETLASRSGLANVSFLHADAQVHPFGERAFDVVISQTGAMFFGDPDAAFANLFGSLRPGGRMALLTWRSAELQDWFRAFVMALTGRVPPTPPVGAPGPFSLAEEGHVRRLLEGAGFGEVDLTPVDEPTMYGRTVDEAHDFLLGLLGWMLRDQEPDQRAASAAALRHTLADHLDDQGVRFRSAAWLVTALRPWSSSSFSTTMRTP